MLLTLVSCKKEQKEDSIFIPPPQGAASSDELSTPIGQARGLNSSLAPSSTNWQRTFVLDTKRAIIAGDVADESIALVTDNSGRGFHSFRTEKQGWYQWSVGTDGATVLAMGPMAAPPPPSDPQAPLPLIDSTRLFFAAAGDTNLTAPAAIGLPKPSRTAPHPVNVIPAVLTADRAAVILEEAPRRPLLVYGAPPGVEPIAPVKFPPTERVLAVPYGRPPLILSVRGRDLLTRPVPEPGKPLEAPKKVAGLIMTPTAITELSAPPACEFEDWSFQIVTQPPAKSMVVGISPSKTVSIALPAKPVQDAKLGCGANKIAIQVVDSTPTQPTAQPKKDEPENTTLAICTLEGACVIPEKPPFRSWLEPHKEFVVAVPTGQGIVAVMTSLAAARWGLYLSQSLDGGKIYEVPRIIGEGTGDRGRIELGALLSFGDRALLLLQADVTGTSRRGWYASVSDDGGLTWGVP